MLFYLQGVKGTGGVYWLCQAQEALRSLRGNQEVCVHQRSRPSTVEARSSCATFYTLLSLSLSVSLSLCLPVCRTVCPLLLFSLSVCLLFTCSFHLCVATHVRHEHVKDGTFRMHAAMRYIIPVTKSNRARSGANQQ